MRGRRPFAMLGARPLVVVLASLLGVVLALGAGVVLTAPDTAIPWRVGGAGGNGASSTNYRLGSTAGQPAIGESQSANYHLGAGYWYGVCAADFDGDGHCDPDDVDDDNDGCTDVREQQPRANASTGGGRNPLYFWDFYDVWTRPDPAGQPTLWVRDKVVNVPGDIFGVAQRFGANDAGGMAPINRSSDALAGPPPAAPAYHPAFDRGLQIGPNVWDLALADGAINVPNDILGVAGQFGHNCV